MSGSRKLLVSDLMERVDLHLGLSEAIDKLLQDYNLGNSTSVDPLFVGHEELNVRVDTNNGKYALKFFNKRKSREIAQNTIDALVNLHRGGIPVPQLVSDKSGNFLYTLPSQIGSGFLCVTKFFNGKTFNETAPTDNDIVQLTSYLGQMHGLKFGTHAEYDFWLSIYLVDEFRDKQYVLSPEDRALLSPVVARQAQLDFTKFSTALVHYDLHRDNAQKSNDGKYCIFDFATVDNGYGVIDLATFIGLFCLGPNNNLDKNRALYKTVIKTYERYRKLSAYERDHLFDLVLGIYASNVLASTYLRVAEGNDTYENLKWYNLGKWGLTTFGQLPKNQGFNILRRSKNDF